MKGEKKEDCLYVKLSILFLIISINMECFEALRRADIYAIGLLYWEVCRRTKANGIYEEYKGKRTRLHLNDESLFFFSLFLVPYYDVVPTDPTFEEMRKVVSGDNLRPSIPNRWSSDQLMNGMAKLMKECWHHNPNVRLPALRIKKSLYKLATSDENIKLMDGEICV